VTLAENGQEAIEQLKEQSFDGVLMDCQMPVMDGYTATKAIRSQQQYKSLPIIAMTANAMAEDKARVTACGMNDHIAKPINVNIMFRTMARWITPKAPKARLSTDKRLSDNESNKVEIPSVLGIDTQAGLAVTQNNKALYLNLLKRFAATYRDFEQLFSDALADPDEMAAVRCAHTLKGTSGNIGAKAIQQAARALEHACEEAHQKGSLLVNGRLSEDINKLLNDVIKEVVPVVSELSKLSEPARPTVESQTLDTDKIKPLFAQLTELIEEFDTDASDVIEQLDPIFQGTAYYPQLTLLAEAIDSFDFDAATELFDTLKQQIG
jgi:polar amino acid transport system substrate-binding protein